jgi:hypothetical protein
VAFEAGRIDEGFAVTVQGEGLYWAYVEAEQRCEAALNAEQAAHASWRAAFERRQEQKAAG